MENKNKVTIDVTNLTLKQIWMLKLKIFLVDAVVGFAFITGIVVVLAGLTLIIK